MENIYTYTPILYNNENNIRHFWDMEFKLIMNRKHPDDVLCTEKSSWCTLLIFATQPFQDWAQFSDILLNISILSLLSSKQNMYEVLEHQT